jgi:MFS family permease
MKNGKNKIKPNSFAFITKDFTRLWFAVLVFAIGTWSEHVTVGYLIYDLTNSELKLTFAFAIRFIPFLFVSNYIGYISDLVSRKYLMMIIMILGSLSMFIMSLIISLDIYNYPIILIYIFISGSLWSSTMLAQQSYSYDITGPDHASYGTAITKGADRIGGTIAGIFSGRLISKSFTYPFLLAGLFQLIASILLIPNLKRSKFSPTTTTKPKLTEILNILKTNKVLLSVILLTCGTEIFGFSHNSIIPVLVKDVLNGNSDDLGFMMVLRQFGGIIGLASIVVFGYIQRKGLWLLNAALGLGLCVLFLGFANNYYIFIIVILFLNIFASSCDSLYQIIAQKSVENHDRGKAMGAWVFALGSGPLGSMLIGFIISIIKANKIPWLLLDIYNSPGPQFALNFNGFILVIIIGVAIYYAQKLKMFRG